MTPNGFDVIGQDVFFDGWRVGSIRRGIPATVHDRVVGALCDLEADAHEKELEGLREEYRADLDALQAEHECDGGEVEQLRGEIATLRGIIHLMGGDVAA